MTKLEKTSALIAELTNEEKAQLLAELLQYFNIPAVGITHTPGVCGGRACIRNTRIPVWTIVEAKKMGATDIELLQSFQGLTAEDITNAMRYYQGHKVEIEADVQDQHEAQG
jgi:uncharacterized protein (DUF433 family)